MSDIADLFARDPLSLTKPDIEVIVKYYREKRAQFNLGDKTAGATKKMKTDGPKITDVNELLGLVTKDD